MQHRVAAIASSGGGHCIIGWQPLHHRVLAIASWGWQPLQHRVVLITALGGGHCIIGSRPLPPQVAAIASSSEAFADFMQSYIILMLVCFPNMALFSLLVSLYRSQCTRHRGKHSCYLYHVLHDHAVWFSNIHFMLQLRSQFFLHKSRTVIISGHTRHVCSIDNEK